MTIVAERPTESTAAAPLHPPNNPVPRIEIILAEQSLALALANAVRAKRQEPAIDALSELPSSEALDFRLRARAAVNEWDARYQHVAHVRAARRLYECWAGQQNHRHDWDALGVRDRGLWLDLAALVVAVQNNVYEGAEADVQRQTNGGW